MAATIGGVFRYMFFSKQTNLTALSMIHAFVSETGEESSEPETRRRKTRPNDSRILYASSVCDPLGGLHWLRKKHAAANPRLCRRAFEDSVSAQGGNA